MQTAPSFQNRYDDDQEMQLCIQKLDYPCLTKCLKSSSGYNDHITCGYYNILLQQYHNMTVWHQVFHKSGLN